MLSSLKVYLLFSLGNFTYIGGMFLMFLGVVLGSISISFIMGWISYKTSNTNITTSIGIAINIFYLIVVMLISIPSELANVILNFFPLASSQLINDLNVFNFELSIWKPYEVLISMLIICVIFSVLMYYDIHKGKCE